MTDLDHNTFLRELWIQDGIPELVIEFENDVVLWKIAPEHLFTKQKISLLLFGFLRA